MLRAVLSIYLAGGNTFGSEDGFEGLPVLSDFFVNQNVSSPPQPVTKYCIIMPIIFETTQYSANPLGYDKVKKPNSNGIITSII